MQVDVQDVEAHVAGPAHAHDRVEVGAVAVRERADLVHEARDLADVLVEQAERVRVGEHDRRDVRPQGRSQGLHVHAAALVAGHGRDLVAAHRHRGRVRAVCRVRDDDALSRVPVGRVMRADDHEAGELAVCAGRGLKRHSGQARDLAQALLELDHELQHALDRGFGLVGMQVREAREPADALVHPRVVLHGAAAERVEAVVHAEVHAGERGEVAGDVHLGQLRQHGRRTPGTARERRVPVGLGHVQLRQRDAAHAGSALVEDHAGRMRAWPHGRGARQLARVR